MPIKKCVFSSFPANYFFIITIGIISGDSKIIAENSELRTLLPLPFCGIHEMVAIHQGRTRTTRQSRSVAVQPTGGERETRMNAPPPQSRAIPQMAISCTPE